MARCDRLVILGLDGATWNVIDPMRRRGVLPNLDALVRRSAHGTLRSTIPPMTAAAWTTMQTGCDAGRHGIFDHRYYEPATGQMRVNNSGRIRVPTMWHALDEAGRAVISLNLPGTYPAPRVRKGAIVSGMDAPHLDAALAGYPAFAARLRAEAPKYDLKYQWKRVPRTVDELRLAGLATIEGFEGRADGAFVADRFQPDWSVLLVQFQNLDPFQHRCWNYLNVDETGIDNPDWNQAAADVLHGLDRQVGRLAELADKRGAAILVVSDHGFGPCMGRVNANRVLLNAGVARRPSPLGRVGRRVRQAVESLKLWDAKRHDPNARGASFATSVWAKFPLDWSRTLAFAPHQDTAAMVYLNRQGAGLDSPRLVDEARNAAAMAFAEARHPETHEPLFPMVLSTADEFGVDPEALGYPDLLALPHEELWVRTKLDGSAPLVEADPDLPGTHRPEGIVAICAPGVAPGRNLAAQLRDVAPTALALLGVPIPAHMQGQPIPGIASGTRRLDSPASQVPPAPHAPSADFEFSDEEQALIEKRLQDLGYLG